MIRLEVPAATIEALLKLDELEGQAASTPSIAGRLAAARSELAPEVLERFESLRAHAHGPALRLARPSHCPSCHVRFAAHLESKLRGRTLLVACPHCRRLLFQLAAPATVPGGKAAEKQDRA